MDLIFHVFRNLSESTLFCPILVRFDKRFAVRACCVEDSWLPFHEEPRVLSDIKGFLLDE